MCAEDESEVYNNQALYSTNTINFVQVHTKNVGTTNSTQILGGYPKFEEEEVGRKHLRVQQRNEV